MMANVDKTAQLNALLTSIQQRWGNTALRPLSAAQSVSSSLLPTGFADLDTLLGGGIARGQAVELLGRPTSGMATLGCKIIAQAQAADAYGIYVDLDSTFDPDYAARCGVQLDRLFLARPDTPLQALDLAHDLLDSGSVAIIALDLGDWLPDVSRLRRLTHALTQSGGVVLLLVTLPLNTNPHTVLSGSPAALRLLVERQTWLERQSDIRGCRARVTVLKHRTAAGKTIEIDIDFENHAGEPS